MALALPVDHTHRDDRRIRIERRLGERRLRLITVKAERRESSERRHALDRRESPAGHLRNAMQMLRDLLGEEGLDREATGVLQRAQERVEFALREVERLTAARSYLGQRLRVQEILPPGADPAQMEILFPPQLPRRFNP